MQIRSTRLHCGCKLRGSLLSVAARHIDFTQFGIGRNGNGPPRAHSFERVKLSFNGLVEEALKPTQRSRQLRAARVVICGTTRRMDSSCFIQSSTGVADTPGLNQRIGVPGQCLGNFDIDAATPRFCQVLARTLKIFAHCPSRGSTV